MNFDLLIKLVFHGSIVANQAGFLSYLELDDALRQSIIAFNILLDFRNVPPFIRFLSSAN